LFNKVWFGKCVGSLPDGSNPDLLFNKVWFGKCVGYVPGGNNPDLLFTKVWFGKCVEYMPDWSNPDLLFGLENVCLMRTTQICCSPRFGLENV
jgi:hypothetical protein